jgi:hypothetical protein
MLIGPIERGVCGRSYGSHCLGRSRHGQSLCYCLADKVLTLTSNILTGLKLTDVWTGYKMFRRDILHKPICGTDLALSQKSWRRLPRWLCHMLVAAARSERLAGKTAYVTRGARKLQPFARTAVLVILVQFRAAGLHARKIRSRERVSSTL